jgi:hypothetical protein
MTPTTALTQALDETHGQEDFARLSGERRLLLLQTVLICGRELLLTGNGAAEQAGRIVTALTNPRLGAAAGRAAQLWAARTDK